MIPSEITVRYTARRAAIYVRQSTLQQVQENLESQRRQYALADRAAELGWPRGEIVVIDDDLGRSGSGVARAGFDRLVAEVGLGGIGAVFALEVSRLARNNRDWYHLLDLCALVGTLIGDGDGLYDPSLFNDRLLLGLKGTMSEVELHLIRSRLSGGLWEAARRGALRTHLPVGYEHDREGAIVLTPDESVRETIALVFRKFAELGSARQVVAHLREENVALPHRDGRDGGITWRPADYAPVHRMLTNPAYAGLYVYGRSKTERRLDPQGRPQSRQRSRPPAEWPVRIEAHHPAFISDATYFATQERLRANWRPPRGEAARAVREGAALLQGVVRCGRCGRRMQVAYSGPGGAARRYGCHQAQRLQAAERACQSLGGVRLDQRVADVFLTALEPAGLEATLAALHASEQAWEQDKRQRLLVVEKARYEAERARRQFEQVEPENRLVARTLEREWEKRLTELTAREGELAGFQTSRPLPLSDEEIAWLRTAGADLRAVWAAETTTKRERKQLLRCLVKEVVVTVQRERHEADVTIVWAGGAATRLISKLNRTGEHHRATSDEVTELVRRLAPHHGNEQIALVLNSRHLLTGQGHTFTRLRVATIRERLGIPSPKATTEAAANPSWMDVPSAARELAVSPDTIRRWAREGFCESRQVMPHAPWTVHVTDELRQRVVPDQPPGWVGLAAAATALGRSKQTILHWVHSGRLEAVQVISGKRKGLRIKVEEQSVGLFADQ